MPYKKASLQVILYIKEAFLLFIEESRMKLIYYSFSVCKI